MKKITESQLKDKVNSLREYLKVYENQQVDEWSIFNPSTWGNGQGYEGLTGGNSRDAQRTQDAAKNSTAGANMALVQHREQLAPGSVASEQGKDGVTYAVDAKGMRTHKIEGNKWVAMNPPTPTEQPELMAAPDAQQAASVTPAAPTSTQVQTDDNGNHLITTPDGKTMVVGPDGKPLENGGREAPPPGEHATKVARFKELIAKAKELRTDAQVTHSKSLGPAAYENTNYFLNKLRLIESRQLNEILSPEEQKEMDDLSAELGIDGAEGDPELSAAINDYNSLKQAAPADAAAAPTDAAAAPAAPAAVAPRPAVKADPGDGAVGKALAALGVSKKDRLNQDFVDSVLGAGKARAGTKESNLALQALFKGLNGQGASVTSTAPAAPAAPAPPMAGGYGSGANNPSLADPRDLEQGQSRGSRPAQPAPNAPGQNARDDLLARQAQAPTGQNARDDLLARQAQAPTGQNARDDLLARQGKVQESVGYNELQRIVSLVNHR